MRTRFDNYEAFKESPYFKVLEDYVNTLFEDNEPFIYPMADLSECIQTIRDCEDSSDETVDSDYIHNTYSLTTKNIKFEVVGSSYRKDHSVCDEEMQDYIVVIDLEAEKKEKAEKKAKEKAGAEAKWKDLFDSKSKEELFEIIKNLPFPKKL